MRLASFFAAAALSAAICSLVSRFWGRFDLPLQATLLCLFPLMALGGVELSARRERTLYVASLFALVAYATFWLAVGVLSDLLNVPVTPWAIWAGVIFGLALALAYRLRVILAGALGALVIALSGQVFHAAGIPWTEIAGKPELTTVAAFGVTLLGPRLSHVDRGFGAAARLTGFGVGLTGVLLLSTFAEMSVLPLSGRLVTGFYQAVALVGLVGLLAIGLRYRWNETVSLAAVMLTIFLLLRFIDGFWDALPQYVFFLALAVLALAWLFALDPMRARLSGRTYSGAAGPSSREARRR